ncbi:Ger(x)C family spore germination protein [Caproiciproducens galactitolivorans]|uniref:Spore germination protein B3 n=1 Tax=Caproiciproducens galactitolivorans TaxID=642589 RepID=A0A4Z0YM75_9FIRM|nr:Ger(x)C family spore germination protein [Caproiciproducens galactitolivorans]QEY34450.1 Ger(x)C family spore germination protein [Caproiciproducens galactitolivorans]TGJ77772.1 spore germination protein B3 precursor [Caproiciproducens galactitolivorans]
MKLKKIFAILLSVALCLGLTGCWNSRELNTLAFATSLGLDKTDKGILMTVQVFNPRAIASQKTVNETYVIIYTQEGKDIMEMVRRMITQSPRKINVTHLQTVIFGEEFAKEGIGPALDFFSREHQFRTDIYFTVAYDSTANQILRTQSKLDANPSNNLFSSIKSSDQIWAGSKSVKIIELINSIISDGKEAVVTGVEITSRRPGRDTLGELEKMEDDPIRVRNLAFFKGDKFAGWLDEDECKGYNYLMGNVWDTVGYVEAPEIGKITTEITNMEADRNVELVNGKPVIHVSLKFRSNIENVTGTLDISKVENLRKIEMLCEKKLKKQCLKSLAHTKEYGSDIFGFGELIHRKYPSYWKTVKENWSEEYKQVPVDLKIDYEIQRTGTLGNTFFKGGSKK